MSAIEYALENDLQMIQAINQSGNDMLKRMQLVYPIICQLQMNTIRKFGFSNDGDGRFRVELYQACF